MQSVIQSSPGFGCGSQGVPRFPKAPQKSAVANTAIMARGARNRTETFPLKKKQLNNSARSPGLVLHHRWCAWRSCLLVEKCEKWRTMEKMGENGKLGRRAAPPPRKNGENVKKKKW